MTNKTKQINFWHLSVVSPATQFLIILESWLQGRGAKTVNIFISFHFQLHMGRWEKFDNRRQAPIETHGVEIHWTPMGFQENVFIWEMWHTREVLWRFTELDSGRADTIVLYSCSSNHFFFLHVSVIRSWLKKLRHAGVYNCTSYKIQFNVWFSGYKKYDMVGIIHAKDSSFWLTLETISMLFLAPLLWDSNFCNCDTKGWHI